MKKQKKKKVYVLTVSRFFPKTHSRAGAKTWFVKEILKSIVGAKQIIEAVKTRASVKKIHTIRNNYELWLDRIKKVNNGEAILSLRYWQGAPYNSKQIEFAKLCEGQVAIEKLYLSTDLNDCDIRGVHFHGDAAKVLSANDGLSEKDFREWFKKHNAKNTLAIIHFTSFRYKQF